MSQGQLVEYRIGQTVYQFNPKGQLLCRSCHSPLMVSGSSVTRMVFNSPIGHNHDDNTRIRGYRCANGHTLQISPQNRCDVFGCDWVGRDTFNNSPDPKVREWPEDYWKRITSPRPGATKIMHLTEDEKRALIEFNNRLASETDPWDKKQILGYVDRATMWEKTLGKKTLADT